MGDSISLEKSYCLTSINIDVDVTTLVPPLLNTHTYNPSRLWLHIYPTDGDQLIHRRVTNFRQFADHSGSL